jgi:hypothetical protein
MCWIPIRRRAVWPPVPVRLHRGAGLDRDYSHGWHGASAPRTSGPRLRGRQPRLAVIDAAAIDARRRLVLIRRDNVEHLLIIGGPTDVVVEQNLCAAEPSERAGASRRPPIHCRAWLRSARMAIGRCNLSPRMPRKGAPTGCATRGARGPVAGRGRASATPGALARSAGRPCR